MTSYLDGFPHQTEKIFNKHIKEVALSLVTKYITTLKELTKLTRGVMIIKNQVIDFNTGDLVWLHVPVIKQRTLSNFWQGP